MYRVQYPPCSVVVLPISSFSLPFRRVLSSSLSRSRTSQQPYRTIPLPYCSGYEAQPLNWPYVLPAMPSSLTTVHEAQQFCPHTRSVFLLVNYSIVAACWTSAASLRGVCCTII